MLEENRTVKPQKSSHGLILSNRENLNITGVLDVDSFDEQTVIAFTELGTITITGVNLHINKINLDTGDLVLDGYISGLNYSEEKNVSSKGFLSKLFK